VIGEKQAEHIVNLLKSNKLFVSRDLGFCKSNDKDAITGYENEGFVKVQAIYYRSESEEAYRLLELLSISDFTVFARSCRGIFL
jgi:hypothetical protein